MKWAILTIILGYIIVWQLQAINVLLLPIGFLLIFGYSVFIYQKRLSVLPGFVDKLRVIISLVIFSIVILAILYISQQFLTISKWWYPPIFGLIVLLRPVFRFLVNLSIHEPKSYGIESVTERGETVRSKSEKKVADWLYQNKIDYEYERKIELPDNQVILSDFYLPAHDIYIEYWGLSTADNETGAKYRKRKNEKIELYDKYDYKLMDIYPHHLFELDKYIPEEIERLTRGKMGFFAKLRALFFGYDKTVSTPVTNVIQEADLFCTNCGAGVTQHGEFCVKCGTQVA